MSDDGSFVVVWRTTNGFVKGGAICVGTELEIGEPFALPPAFIIVDGEGARVPRKGRLESSMARQAECGCGPAK